MPSAGPESDIARTLGIEQSSGRSKQLNRWLGWGSLAVMVATLAIIWAMRDTARTVAFKTHAVQRGNLTVTVTATGTLEPTNQVDVGSELSGIIDTVEVDYNDRVKVGQVVARLDTDKLKAQVLQSQAALEAAQAKVLEAQATVLETRLKSQRCVRLAAKKMCSEEDVDTSGAAYERAQAAVASAKARVSEARAKLDFDRTNLAKAVIRSPIQGIVLVRNVEPGQTVAATLQAPVLFTLAEDIGQMELHVDVDEADVGQVEGGQEATFTVDAYPDRAFPARVIQVRYGAREVDGVVTYETVLNVDNSDLSLRPGMTATADILVKKVESAMLVPNAALRFTPPVPENQATKRGRGLLGQLLPHPPIPTSKQRKKLNGQEKQRRVWVLRGDQPVAVPVTVGATDGIVTEVLAGDVEAGMAVVVEAISKTQ